MMLSTTYISIQPDLRDKSPEVKRVARKYLNPGDVYKVPGVSNELVFIGFSSGYYTYIDLDDNAVITDAITIGEEDFKVDVLLNKRMIFKMEED